MSLLFAEDQIKVSGDSPSRWMAALALLLIHFSVEWGSEGRKKNVSLSQIIHKDSNVALISTHVYNHLVFRQCSSPLELLVVLIVSAWRKKNP